jgi:hypothetical protein
MAMQFRSTKIRSSKNSQILKADEISFDPAAREEYLTGFHKRKQARLKYAQELSKRKEKEERQRERRQVRLYHTCRPTRLLSV